MGTQLFRDQQASRTLRFPDCHTMWPGATFPACTKSWDLSNHCTCRSTKQRAWAQPHASPWPSLPIPPPPHPQRSRSRQGSCLVPGSLSHHLWNQQKTWERSPRPQWGSSGTTSQSGEPTIPLWKHHVQTRMKEGQHGHQPGTDAMGQSQGCMGQGQGRCCMEGPKGVMAAPTDGTWAGRGAVRWGGGRSQGNWRAPGGRIRWAPC